MSTSTAALKAQFDMQTRLFINTLEGITDSESTTRENDHVNHMKFIAGHILNTRVNFLTQLTGGQPDTSYVEKFGRGVKIDPNGDYPPLSEITSKWNTTANGIGTGIANAPEEMLAAKSPIAAPIADDTMRGLFAFLISHEAYHIGQLGLLRKMIGKEAMSYN
jgi:hypothetical protein